MQPINLILVTLATFYTAYAVSSTHGPWRAFEWLRTKLPLGGLTTCLVCLSPWTAALFYVLMFTPLYVAVDVLAIAGGSVLVWRYTGANNV